MRRVFADTLYFVATTLRNDEWNAAALQAEATLGDAELVTTEEVLTEYLTSVARMGPFYRAEGAALVRELMFAANIKVVQQSHETFLAGLRLYEQRPDKEYSMTDCISMSVMRQRKISAVLTNDHHFTQEGFTILISKGGT